MLNKEQMMEEALEAAHAALNELSMRTVEKASLRDQFAMAALTGLLSNPKLVPTVMKEGPTWFEANAFAYADAMMEKRK
jgi:hypothetical protein